MRNNRTQRRLKRALVAMEYATPRFDVHMVSHAAHDDDSELQLYVDTFRHFCSPAHYELPFKLTNTAAFQSIYRGETPNEVRAKLTDARNERMQEAELLTRVLLKVPD